MSNIKKELLSTYMLVSSCVYDNRWPQVPYMQTESLAVPEAVTVGYTDNL